MKSLSTIKLEIKDIQNNFNPLKSTYKILDDVVVNNHSIEDMVYMISKIHGMSKYPEEIRDKFSTIVSDLKELRDEEVKYKERKNMELEKKMQEASTKELKDIISLLEKEMKKEGQEVKKDVDVVEENQFLEESQKVPEKEEIVKSKTKLLVLLVIITLIIIVLLFLFY